MIHLASSSLRLVSAAFVGLALAASSVAGAADKADKAPKAQDKGKAAEQQAFIVLVPQVVVSQDSYANGCWIRLFDNENFRGQFITLVGPADVYSLETTFGNFARKWESAVIGSRATVAAYDNENFTQKVANFKPGQRVPDLDPKMGFFENIRSLRITCSK